MTFLKRLKDWFNKPSSRWISEEEDLAESLAELDRTNPGWDEPLRVNGAVRRLEKGTKRESAVAIYGEDTVKAAEQKIADKTAKKDGPAI